MEKTWSDKWRHHHPFYMNKVHLCVHEYDCLSHLMHSLRKSDSNILHLHTNATWFTQCIMQAAFFIYFFSIQLPHSWALFHAARASIHSHRMQRLLRERGQVEGDSPGSQISCRGMWAHIHERGNIFCWLCIKKKKEETSSAYVVEKRWSSLFNFNLSLILSCCFVFLSLGNNLWKEVRNCVQTR